MLFQSKTFANLLSLFVIITYFFASRKKLLQNLVSLYAANVVFANFVFTFMLTVAVYVEYFGYTQVDDGYKLTPESFRLFWHFIKIIGLALFFGKLNF